MPAPTNTIQCSLCDTYLCRLHCVTDTSHCDIILSPSSLADNADADAGASVTQ